MAIPQHRIHVYQRPAQGSNFVKSFPAYNYQHSIISRGWFDTASCDLAVRSEGEGQDILNNYLGAFVAVYADNPAQPIWEGLVNRITFNVGGASYTISLDEMTNRVNVLYTGAANAAAITVFSNDTDSQAIYGIKHEQIEFGGDPSAGTQRAILQATILAQRAWPQKSVSQAQGQTNLVHMELIGIHHTLEWQIPFSAVLATATGTGTTIQALTISLANGSTFYDNTNLSLIAGNPATTPDQQRGISTWDRMAKIAETGDGTDYWVVGITPTDRNTGDRVLYYRIANSAIEYTARQADGLRPRNPYGKLIPPWLVVPDRGIRVTDLLVGYGNFIEGDPRDTYIQGIQYDANSQQVQWFGADDTTARGAFLLKRGFKPQSKSFGAPLRTITT